MSCVPCEEKEKEADITYVRIDRANVGLIGCDEHVRKILDALEAIRQMVAAGEIEMQDSGRPVVRIKKQS